jgi:hypothetical protein
VYIYIYIYIYSVPSFKGFIRSSHFVILPLFVWWFRYSQTYFVVPVFIAIPSFLLIACGVWGFRLHIIVLYRSNWHIRKTHIGSCIALCSVLANGSFYFKLISEFYRNFAAAFCVNPFPLVPRSLILSVCFLRSLLALLIFKPTWNVIFQAELEGKPSDINCLQRTQTVSGHSSTKPYLLKSICLWDSLCHKLILVGNTSRDFFFLQLHGK